MRKLVLILAGVALSSAVAAADVPAKHTAWAKRIEPAQAAWVKKRPVTTSYISPRISSGEIANPWFSPVFRDARSSQ